MRTIRSLSSLVFAVGLIAAAVAAAGRGGHPVKAGGYRPRIDPAAFQTTIDNPYYPLIPGTTRKLIERSGRDSSENEITVTHDTKVVMGVTCVVVRDVVREKGKVKEDTYEWFAQDKQGTVWYFGEDTREFGPGGRVSTEGSWEAGVGKAQPGVIMWANPAPGEPYRQEYGPGIAEDMAQIVATNDSVTVPFGAFNGCVRTKEWSLLESGTEKKWYAKGVGIVREESATHEIAALVSVTGP